MAFRPPIVRALLLCLTLLVTAGDAIAEGKLRGSTTGPDGEPMADVEIRMVPLKPGLPPVTARSNKKGKFVFGLLRNSEYRLVAFKDGFRISRIDANLEVPGDESLWAFHEELLPGAEPPYFSVTGVTEVTYDLQFQEYDGDVGEHGTGTPVSPTVAIIELIQSGELDKAAEEIAGYLERAPDAPALHYLHAFQLRTSGKPDEALAAVGKALSLDPAFEGAQLLKGRILQDKGELEPALSAYQTESMRAMSDEVVRDAYLGAAALLIQLERNTEAITTLEQLIAIVPDHAGAHKELADLYLREGNNDKAQAMLTKAEMFGATDPNILFNMGAERFNAGDLEAARDYFKKALDADPDFADAHMQLAFTLLNLGDMKGAASNLERFIELAPEDDANAQTARTLLQQLEQQQP